MRYLPYIALFLGLVAGSYAVAQANATYFTKDGKEISMMQAIGMLTKTNNQATIIRCQSVQLSAKTGNLVLRR